MASVGQAEALLRAHVDAVEVVRVVVGVVAVREAVVVGEAVVGGVVVVVRQLQALEIFCERSVLAAG